jgi:hypothetical protein
MVGRWTLKLLSIIGFAAGLAMLSFAQNQNGMNGGASSVPKGVAAGSTLGSNGTHNTSVYQIKAVLDVRDITGVDCTGIADSSAALNALTGNPPTTNNLLNGKSLIFPPQSNGIPCQIRLANTWLIKNQSAFKLDGITRAGANGGTNVAPHITWTGASGGSMIDMEYTDGFEVDGLAISGNNLAGIGINVDKTGSGGTVNTTDGVFRNLNISSGGSSISTWKGMAFSTVSTQNVEDMRVRDSSFSCSGGVGIGISVGSSPNAKNEVFEHNGFTTCLYGVAQGGGSIQVRDSEFTRNGGTCGSGTGADILLGGNSDTDIISGNLDESSTQFISSNDGNGLSAPVVVTGNHWGTAGCFNPSLYWLNPGISANTWIIEGNSWDADGGAQTKLIGTALTGQAQINTRGNIYPNGNFTPWWLQGYSGHADDIGIQNGNQIFSLPATSAGSYPNAGYVWPSPFVVFRGYYNNGSRLLPEDYAVQNVVGGGFLIEGVSAPSSGMFAFGGSYPGLNVVQVSTPSQPSVGAQGTTGDTSYTYSVVAYSGAMNTPGSPTNVVTNGNATLSSRNYNLVQFSAVAGATQYCVWLTATSGSANLGKIGCTPAIQNPTLNTNLSNGMAFGSAYAANLSVVGSFYKIEHTSNKEGDSSRLPSSNTTGTLSLPGQITSTLAAGTAPLRITSATPVSNLTLTAHPQVYEAGVLTTSEKIYTNTQSLIGGAATHTFARSFTYTSSSTFGCTCTDQTAANACRAIPASASTVTLAGTGSDVLWLECAGH